MNFNPILNRLADKFSLLQVEEVEFIVCQGVRVFRTTGNLMARFAAYDLKTGAQMQRDVLFSFLMVQFDLSRWCKPCCNKVLQEDSRQMFAHLYGENFTFQFSLCSCCAGAIQ